MSDTDERREDMEFYRQVCSCVLRNLLLWDTETIDRWILNKFGSLDEAIEYADFFRNESPFFHVAIELIPKNVRSSLGKFETNVLRRKICNAFLNELVPPMSLDQIEVRSFWDKIKPKINQIISTIRQ
ncbi:MAG: hypothetical protein AAF456_02005 [Planctomycetota bacterium]